MRPTRSVGFVAALALGSLAPVAQADPSAPAPTFRVAGGNITVTANGTTHLNNGFPWKYLDGGGNKVKQLSDFSFSDKDNPASVQVSGVPASGTLRGAYCDASNCYTFTAACTDKTCSITGT
jgi:hypothetical protein